MAKRRNDLSTSTLGLDEYTRPRNTSGYKPKKKPQRVATPAMGNMPKSRSSSSKLKDKHQRIRSRGK